jgi:hypothetical protein
MLIESPSLHDIQGSQKKLAVKRKQKQKLIEKINPETTKHHEAIWNLVSPSFSCTPREDSRVTV